MYSLLPFRFERLNGKEILVNEVGDFLIVPSGTSQRIANKEIEKAEELYKDLTAGYYISETPIPELIDLLAVRLRTKKAFLNNFTVLHIFVLTLRCNQNCIYCQASSRECHESIYDMTQETMVKAIDLMLKSPSPSLTMEFQGGEPSLMPELLRFAIETTEQKNKEHLKEITYVLCTNSINLNDEILDICLRYKVLISTSLDGFETLHNHNRGKSDSYSHVVKGINKARTVLGFDRVSALMTASEESLKYPKEIINAYLENGFHSVFLRALNPYGLATKYSNWGEYYDQFINFYKEALNHIIELNKSGIFFIEEFTALILRKVLTPFSIGFVDLQSPSGIINSVIVYNYDGYVYASDESRMLAEHGDYTFRLGSVNDHYDSLFYGKKAQKTALIWANETIAGCSDCAFLAYCGADPVRNHSTQGDMYGFRPTSSFCKKHKQIIQHIFSLIIDREDEVLPIFKRWINNNLG
jgi:His-Xaa-Ser system radical SAM maturase HxsB